jgi:hypothetical protein
MPSIELRSRDVDTERPEITAIDPPARWAIGPTRRGATTVGGSGSARLHGVLISSTPDEERARLVRE